MAIGNLLGGFAKGYVQSKQAKERREDEKKERDAKTKLFELELKRLQTEQQKQLQQQDASAQLFDRMQTMGGMSSPAGQKFSLTDILSDPVNAQLMLKSGMVGGKDLLAMQAGPQEPDAVRTLRALAGDPALMKAEIARRQAGAANTTLNLDTQGLTKPPTGYFRPNPTKPGLQLEPGGPAEREIVVGASEALKSVDTSAAALDKLAAAATALKDNNSLWRATGLAGAVPNVPGSKAADIEADLTSLQSQVAFGVLQAMREASKTGGALGAVSERELDLLQNNLASLDRKKSPEAFRAALQKIIDYTADAKRRIRDAHQRTYGTVIDESGAAGGAGGAKVIDFKDLPP